MTRERIIAKRVAAVCCLAGAGIVAVLLFAFDPATSGIFPPCPFRSATGLECPGCGSARAMHSAMRGDLPAALALNPMILLFLPVAAYGSGSLLAIALRGKPLPPLTRSAPLTWLLLALIVAFWIYRNTPLPLLGN